MLLYPAKDFCSNLSPRKLHQERCSSKGTLREITLTSLEEQRELIIEPLPSSLPHKARMREWAPIVSVALPAIAFPCVWVLPYARTAKTS